MIHSVAMVTVGEQTGGTHGTEPTVSNVERARRRVASRCGLEHNPSWTIGPSSSSTLFLTVCAQHRRALLVSTKAFFNDLRGSEQLEGNINTRQPRTPNPPQSEKELPASLLPPPPFFLSLPKLELSPPSLTN